MADRRKGKKQRRTRRERSRQGKEQRRQERLKFIHREYWVGFGLMQLWPLAKRHFANITYKTPQTAFVSADGKVGETELEGIRSAWLRTVFDSRIMGTRSAEEFLAYTSVIVNLIGAEGGPDWIGYGDEEAVQAIEAARDVLIADQSEENPGEFIGVLQELNNSLSQSLCRLRPFDLGYAKAHVEMEDHQLIVRVEVEDPQVRHFGDYVAFRCGSAWGDIDEITWGKVVVDGRRKDVYALSHLLRRICERLEIPPDHKTIMCDFVMASILEYQPPAGKGIDEEHLIPFVVNGIKLGYIACKPVEDVFLASTFLFLTMAQTPEGRRLSALLHSQRRDLEETGLVEIGTFLGGDIERESALGKILVQCGCGHLLDLRDTFDISAASRRPVAGRIEHYFGLGG